MFRRAAFRQLPCQPYLAGASRTSRRTLISRRAARDSPGRVHEQLNLDQLSRQSYDYHRKRQIFLICGTVAGTVSFIYTAWKLKKELDKRPTLLDSSLPSTDPLSRSDAIARKVVVHDEEGREVVPTGNSTVKEFPRTIQLPSYASSSGPSHPAPLDPAATVVDQTTSSSLDDYTLAGLGLRTVSFLGIQVYVVGFYIATADIAALQSALVKKVNPIATTLVPGEREQLRAALLDPATSEEIWRELLDKGIPARSAFRVVPVRDTDFHHLRDGFVRAIQARSPPASGGDDGFGEAMRAFRALFNRGSVPKRKELLLIRDGQGRLSVVYDDGRGAKEGRPEGRQLLGTIEDERISRALWLNYLAGTKVASEPARKNIVEGMMEFVERPVGTVAAQVV